MSKTIITKSIWYGGYIGIHYKIILIAIFLKFYVTKCRKKLQNSFQILAVS